MSPQSVERCVKHLMNDPDFKPQKGRTKEESAWAICYAQYNQNKDVAKTLRNRAK